MRNHEGPPMPERSPEQETEEKRKILAETIEWFERIQARIQPERLVELKALASFAEKNLKTGQLSERDATDDSEAAVAEEISGRFKEYHKWLMSKDAQEDTENFRERVKSWFAEDAPNEALVALMANHMSLEEQEEAGLVEEK